MLSHMGLGRTARSGVKLFRGSAHKTGAGWRLGVLCAGFLLVSVLSPLQSKADFIIQFERDLDAAGGSEVGFQTYDTLADLAANNTADVFFSPIDVLAPFSTTGLAFDGNQYIIQFERDLDAAGGSEVGFQTYDTLADLAANNTADVFFSPIDVLAPFSTTGLAFDGNQYIIQFERDLDAAGGSEVGFQTYDTLADLAANNTADVFFSPIDVLAPFSTTGLAFDGNQYIIQFERDLDAAGGSEVGFQTYDTLADLAANNTADVFFSPIDVLAPFSTTGLAFDESKGVEIPEPSSLALLGLGLAIIAYRRLRAAAREPLA